MHDTDMKSGAQGCPKKKPRARASLTSIRDFPFDRASLRSIVDGVRRLSIEDAVAQYPHIEHLADEFERSCLEHGLASVVLEWPSWRGTMGALCAFEGDGPSDEEVIAVFFAANARTEILLGVASEPRTFASKPSGVA